MTLARNAVAAVTVGLLVCCAFFAPSLATAGPQQQASTPEAAAGGTAVSAEVSADQPIEEIVITGSLIPHVREVTAVPTTVISSDDLLNKGYVSVADALQQQVYSTGSVQGAQFSGGFTPGVETLSLFGLSPSYVKYLIDGRPMADYPALYNGTDVVTNLSGIPEDLVDHIDILPGGQSSLYGSDAIAGVVNVIMKKNLEEPVFTARLGGYKDGGGTDRRVTAAAGHTFGAVNVMGGIEYEKIDPIWGYQRDLTKSYYNAGTGPAVAERDWLVYSPFTDPTLYYFMDPNNCANVSSQFGGSVAVQTRADHGQYCGTTTSGYNTIGNSTESTQGYVRATADLSPALQLYADALLDHETAKFSVGSLFWDTTDYKDGVIYDPNLDDFVGLQHIFTPEEAGGVGNTLNSAITDAWRATLGAQGELGHSHWTYDLGFMYAEQKLTEDTHVMLAGPTDAYFNAILGPDLGPDPYGFGDSTRTPNYAQFYVPISQAQYASMSTVARSRSRTEDSMLRGQLTNSALFQLPGGPAGIALVAEVGNQDWNYTPDPGYFNGDIWGYTAVAGDGHRSRYALTGELRLPFDQWWTLTGSTRYDSFHVSGSNVASTTYNLGLELRPVSSWLLRGRIGTAFKAPTLADEFQGQSGYFAQVNDYYLCQKQGYTGSNISNCPDAGIFVFGTTSGNTNLKPITANVSSIGTVWAPTNRLSISLDYLHWNISNEVNQQSSDQLLITENQCRQGTLSSSSPTCVAALAQVVRDSFGDIVSISTPKINVSNETVNAFVAEGRYGMNLGAYGRLEFQAAWTDMLTHTNRVYPGDPTRDALSDPTWSQEFKSKINGSVTWDIHNWSSTVYLDRHGASPNYVATLQGGYSNPGAGTLPPWTITNLTTRYQWSHQLELTLSVLNVFDKMPPEDHTYPGTTSSPYNIFNYNVYGRSYYAQLSYRFGR
jgi:outer membrane receptor protein involved in Fe transport